MSLGCGIGLRPPHYSEILRAGALSCDWFEAISENYMDTGGRPIQILEKIRQNYPIGLHGVALSIGSVDSLYLPYLEKLKTLVDRIEPAIVSDHICWSGVGGEHLHDLLPLPFTEESLCIIVDKTDQVQNFLGRRILLENASTYVTFKHSEMSEWDFVRQVAERSGCGLLLDINNVYVNAKNHGFDPHEYLRNIPGELVGQIHLAGHTDKGKYLFDTHSSPVIDDVWKLYEEALALWGKKTTLIEWDEDIPEFSRLVEECDKARKISENIKKSGVRGLGLGVRQSQSPTPNTQSLSLKDLQIWMRSYTKKGTGLDHERDLSPFLDNSDVERLEIYRDGYYVRTEDSLKEIYEAVRHVLGDDAFHNLAIEYTETFSSPYYNLNIKGDRFPDFLKSLIVIPDKRSAIRNPEPGCRVKPGMTDESIKSLPFLPDLAQLEWKIAEAFHSFDQPVFDASTLSKIKAEDWDQLLITFQPSLFLLESAWPILDIWQERKTPIDQIKINLENRPQKILIGRRPNREVFCRLLDENEFYLLSQLKLGKMLGEALEDGVGFWGLRDGTDQSQTPSPQSLTRMFSSWMQEGFISDVKVSS